MEAKEIINYLRQQNFTVQADGEYLELSPSEKITEELKQRLRQHKREILAELKREERLNKVLAILQHNSKTKRAFITDMNSDPNNVVITIGIRDQFSFEMTIPKDRYDDFLILEMLSLQTVQ